MVEATDPSLPTLPDLQASEGERAVKHGPLRSYPNGYKRKRLITAVKDFYPSGEPGDGRRDGLRYCSFPYSAWLPSDGGRRRQRRKANPPQQALETLVVAQDVHARSEALLIGPKSDPSLGIQQLLLPECADAAGDNWSGR